MINPRTTFSSGADEDTAFQDLFENHLPLVRSIVERIKRKLPGNLETEDLYSIGVTGLVAAARNYRPSQERTFAAYAATRISEAILEELRVLERKEVLSLLAQHMAELPDMPKKVLAMYYYENMRLSEIAACFRLTESRICQIHTQTIALLRNYLPR
jgi:DNA-directed RNA polymerase specialized sigma subunit